MSDASQDRDPVRYSTDAMVQRLALLLGDIAAAWRGSHGDTAKQQLLVTTYHNAYELLTLYGWKGVLDLESMLPNVLMPESLQSPLPHRWKQTQSKPAK